MRSAAHTRWTITLGLGVVLATMIGQAANTYVSPAGNDGNDGLTPGTAKLTVQAAAAAAGPGDTIFVAAGTYTGAGNQQLDWNAYKDRSIVGAGPNQTIFQLTDVPFVNRLEMQTMAPVFANFKVEMPASAATSYDAAVFRFGDGGANMSVMISNVWMQGTYDGDQVAEPVVAGTDGRRNGAAVWLSAFGTVNNYKGTLRIVQSCISEFGRALAFNDYNSQAGANTTIFQNCTIVNCADTGAGWVDGSTIWVRSGGTNRWLMFTDCVFSHTGIDPGCDAGTWGVRGIAINSVDNKCILSNNLFHTNSIARGYCYYENAASYIGLAGEENTTKPIYTTVGGVDYVYVRNTPSDMRGWRSIPEPGCVIGMAALALACIRRGFGGA